MDCEKGGYIDVACRTAGPDGNSLKKINAPGGVMWVCIEQGESLCCVVCANGRVDVQLWLGEKLSFQDAVGMKISPTFYDGSSRK